MRKAISLLAAGLLGQPAVTLAQSTAESSPLVGNAGLFSQYIFRGLSQTGGRPAMQGGLDYAHTSGLYMGTWMSNVSILQDVGVYKESSLEWDFYGGYKNTFGKSDFGYDIGVLQYYYPGQRVPGATTANTRELYGALSWKWLSAKYSRSVTDRTFGVPDSKGSRYLDFSLNVPLGEKFTAVAHYGIQHFTGNIGLACGSNDACASYKDWKLGGSYAMPQAWSLGAYVTGTRMTATQRTNYTINGREIGKTALTAYLQKTF